MNTLAPARLVFATLAACLLAVVSAAAQDATSQSPPPPPARFSMGPIVPFLEATDVFWSAPDFRNPRRVDGRRDFNQPWFKLEANIFPHLIFRQTFTDVIEIEAQNIRADDEKKEFSYSISGTPGVRLRMLTSESSPVRTPSFTPRLNFQGMWARNLEETLASARKRGNDVPRGSISLYEAHVRVAHYSNGQEGCLSLNQSRANGDDQTDCLPESVPLDAGTINRKNGSFSTNFVAVGMHYSRNRLRAENPQGGTRPSRAGGEPDLVARDWLANREIRVGVELEGHFLNDDIKDYYSSWRVNASGGIAWRDKGICDRRLDLAAGATVGLDVKDGVSNNSWSAQATCMPLNRGGWGFFVRWVGGQDYYNVQLFERINRIQLGLTFNQNGFFGFRARPPALKPQTPRKG